jgi:hypothetical protein
VSGRRKGRPRTERPLEGRSGPPKPPRDSGKPQLNKYNGYKCPACGGAWLSVDLDEGVTPMFSPCFAMEGCRGTAYSMGYPSGPPKNLPLLIEWYKPVTTLGLSYEAKLYVEKGGLVRRATRNAPDWVRRIA